jgi:hypothetical protein
MEVTLAIGVKDWLIRSPAALAYRPGTKAVRDHSRLAANATDPARKKDAVQTLRLRRAG